MAVIQNIMEGDRPKSLAEFKEIFNKCIDQYLTDTPTDCVISQEKAGRILKVLQNDPDFSDSEITSYVKQDKIQLKDFPLLRLQNVLCTVKKGRKTANRLNDDLFGRFRRVVLKEEFFDMIYKAHSQHGSRNHLGFEKTIFQLKRNYSHIPCEVVLKFMKMCPVCAGSVPEENISLFCLKYEDDIIPADTKCQQNPRKYIKKEKPKKGKKLSTTTRKTVRAKTKTTTATTARAKTKAKATSAKKTKATAKKTETTTRRAKRTLTSTTTTTTRETSSAHQPKANTNIKISSRIFGERPSQQDHDYVRTQHHLPITYSLAGPKNSSVPNFRDYSKNQRVHVLRASFFMAVGRVTIIDINELQTETAPSNQFTLVVHYVDLWSKYSIFWPLCKKDISELALGIAKNVFAYFGAPRQLIYNGCTMQAAEQLEEVLRVWSSQINVTTSILEDPLASSGPLHWRIFEDLKSLPQDSWESHLAKLQYLANTKFVKTHGRVTPYEAVFGHMPLTETFVSPVDTQSKTPTNGSMTNVRKKQRSSTGSKGPKASTASGSVPANVSSKTSNGANSGGVYEAQLDPLPSQPYPVACTINIANRSPRSLLPSTLTVLQQTTAPTPMSG
uniref:Integrase catalytic domain-containing protein n=1 Tax=Octopus bimaculoides TaxID=37653 RepID=A0A0L8G2L0_OCTBM